MHELFGVLVALGVIGVVLVIPVILLVRLSGVCRGVEDVQRRLLNLERMLARNPEAPKPPAQDRPPPDVQTQKTEGAKREPVTPVQPSAPPLPPKPVEPTAFERAVARAWNWLIIGEEFRKPGESWEYAAATNWLLRVGIVVVLAGVAFFLKYSIEKGLMGPLGRVALSLAAGIGLIVLGVRLLFKKYHLLGQGLAGAGFVMLYFAFYAASGMYHLMPNGAAFAMMVCVTAAAGVLSVYYQSLLIALLGVVGGYATPVMIGSSGGNAYFFYAYVLLLGAGVLGISLARRWPLLNVLGMLASYGLAFLYCGRHHLAAELLKDLVFLSAVHLLYLFSVIVIHLRKRIKTGVFEWTAIFLNAGIYWAWAFLLFKPAFGKEGTGLVSLAVSAVYVALVYASLKRDLMDKAVMSLFVGLAAVFLAMSPMLMLTGEWLTAAWCLQALAMFWLSHRTGQTFLGKAAVVLFALACVHGMAMDLERMYGRLHPWALKGAAFWKAAGLRLLTYGVLPVTLTAAWRIAREHRQAAKVLALVLVQVWLYLTLESGVIARVYAPGFREGAVTLVWTLFAFALLFAGIRARGKWLRWCGLGLFALAVAKLLASDLDGLGTLYRIIAFISVGVLLVLGSFVYLKYRSLFEPGAGEQRRE
ncbi:MAG TPA: DUF2339 domain-containing protein [Kiritimatiellia bacterium]|nr:DUF2339 domain-containing protein [Kiritimatiellia bacterium]HPS06359.1 DUF2339 domain-containing protein [Kiritimatiellia bacterium]